MPNRKGIHVTIITYFAEGMKEIMYAVYSGNILMYLVHPSPEDGTRQVLDHGVVTPSPY